MDRDPVKTAVRNGRKRRRLPPDARCFFCSVQDLAALRVESGQHLNERVQKSILEQHHVLGQELDPDWTVVLCLNHHAQVTESQARNGVVLEPQAHVLDRVVSWLRALVAFLESMGAAVRRLLEELEGHMRSLDSGNSTWRQRKERP